MFIIYADKNNIKATKKTITFGFMIYPYSTWLNFYSGQNIDVCRDSIGKRYYIKISSRKNLRKFILLHHVNIILAEWKIDEDCLTISEKVKRSRHIKYTERALREEAANKLKRGGI
jgi:hypothetical protein